MSAETSLTRLRLQGLRVLLFASWLWTLMLGVATLLLPGVHGGGQALALSMLVNILPTLMLLQQRTDIVARLAMGTLAAVQPAIGLFLLSGHAWQMDGHMYFFVALAGLALLYDWRPIWLGAFAPVPAASASSLCVTMSLRTFMAFAVGVHPIAAAASP